jgi:hypothetical protein
MGLVEGAGKLSIVRGDENSTRGWRSRYYGQKEPTISVMLETDRPRACFWSYFGFETDQVEIGETLKVRSGDWDVKIDLDALNK